MESVSQSGAINYNSAISEQEFINCILRHDFEDLEKPIVEESLHECMNYVLEKSLTKRQLASIVFSHLIRRNILSIECFKEALEGVLENVGDLVLDVPNIWKNIAEIISPLIEDCIIPLSEMKSVFLSLRHQGFVGKFLGELLTKVSLSKGPMWVTDKWNQSGLQLIDLIDQEREDVDKIIMEYNLEFLTTQ